ncbi:MULTISPECIES: DUF6737 family protein [Chroococcidiopsis]|uniref:DUF6737 domain-containing protein n=1 Tax=Chroococcidiopsis thermalis (strain PCC 7203) TaxID=251229 RepID=K9TSP2_CHRTP|nr:MULTISPECIES: DUF6737 family protein [Chroococcidiopsis]AFY85822.1 hypothetical protein Chro_0267 [Chroococcidiopsis thermalis PCC 7203]URD50664.1 hypothetical protein M5J74_01445 [Chroococcidiopsis sp. CCNUC1]
MHQLPDRKPVSVWNYKPWWCQPWSIFLTGVTLISGSWLLVKTWWLTILVAIPVLTWMTFFLFIYPRVVIQNGILDALPPNDE